MEFDNIILVTDSYKFSHWKQYPPGTTKLYSYFESRGGKFDQTVFFGLQYIIKRWLAGRVVTEEKIQEAKEFAEMHFELDYLFNEEGWRHILTQHQGRLPLRIKAVPEGSVIPSHNVLFTVENTDPKVPWLTNWLETLLLQVWYPLTVATLSRYQKELLAQYLVETADDDDLKAVIPLQLHDFGFRGCSSVEQAAIGGAAHLVNFRGTDTIAGCIMARKYYACSMAGFSVPAAEHSTMTAWGSEEEAELKACDHMLSAFPNGILSVVSDSYNIYNCCQSIWGGELKDKVIERGSKSGNILVIRPDSGDPNQVLPKVLDILGEKFGYALNSKGYKVLPSYLKVIQGDGISYDSLKKILATLKDSSWSTSNLIFGSGGSLLQRLDRDTQKCAFKCSYAEIDGLPVNVYKDPVTDPGKASKKGRLVLEKRETSSNPDYEYLTHEEGSGDVSKDVLVTVFENGELIREYTFDEVRDNAKINIAGFRL